MRKRKEVSWDGREKNLRGFIPALAASWRRGGGFNLIEFNRSCLSWVTHEMPTPKIKKSTPYILLNAFIQKSKKFK